MHALQCAHLSPPQTLPRTRSIQLNLVPRLGNSSRRGYLFTIEGVGAVDACNVYRARWLNSIDVRRLLFSCYIQGIVFEKTLNYFNKLGVTEHTYKRYQGLSYVWQCKTMQDNAMEGFCETTHWNVIVQLVKCQTLHAGLVPCVSSWRGRRRGLGVRGRVVACLAVPVTALPQPRPASRGPVQAGVHPKCNLMTSSGTRRESQAFPAICPSEAC